MKGSPALELKKRGEPTAAPWNVDKEGLPPEKRPGRSSKTKRPRAMPKQNTWALAGESKIADEIRKRLEKLK